MATATLERPAVKCQIPALDMRLSRDPAAYERIFYDASVAPDVLQKGQEPCGFAGFFADPSNIGFLFDDCCFLAHALDAPYSFEVHSAALPHRRGRYVVDAASTAIKFMFFATPATELLTRVVDGNVKALALTAKVGFGHEFRRKSAWQTSDGLRDVDYFAMRYPEWVKRQDWLKTSGQWFHSLLGETQTHKEDEAHDIYVGAAVEMLLGGQPDKAVAYYNRWAKFAGYEPVSIVSYQPLTIDIVSHLITVDSGRVEVKTCL